VHGLSVVILCLCSKEITEQAFLIKCFSVDRFKKDTSSGETKERLV